MPEIVSPIRSSSQHKKEDAPSILYLTTFPPRKCGIATFTQDVVNCMDELLSPTITSKVAAMNAYDITGYRYPRKVIYQLSQDNANDYVKLARRINRNGNIKLVNIQHEFGIFGGEWGDYLVPFCQTLTKPSVINFHTVLPEPVPKQKQVVRSLADNVRGITVMTDMSRQILIQDYAIPGSRITIVPHGIHSRPFTSSRQARMSLGFSDRVVLSTFGLLNRGKGLEYVIEALPEVIKRFPNFVYIYFGATHPTVLDGEGETYRNEIIDRIFQLGLFDHVRLYNKFFPLSELLHFLKATDIYISTGLDPNQAVSGTLSYALGTGRPVISTAFSNARELVTDDVGILVDFENPKAYTEAIIRLLEDEQLREQMGKNAYFKTRRMIWANVAVQYAKVFSQHARSLARISEKKSLPNIKLDHLVHLTDSFGIAQFARLTRPDYRYGYTLDDNARALLAASIYYGKLGASSRSATIAANKRTLLKLINIYLNFVQSCYQENGGFINYMKKDRTPDEAKNTQSNLEDANGRALLALAATVTTRSLPKTIRRQALELLQSRIEDGVQFESPRSIALWIKALATLQEKKVDAGIKVGEILLEQCDRLVQLYDQISSPDWQWFETYLTYSNAVLCEAMLMGFEATRKEDYYRAGKASLDFLIKESYVDGVYMPVGEDGWYQREGKRIQYDQQPEEANSMVLALNRCYEVTRDPRYQDLMRRAFFWFLGDNSLNQVVYDRHTGGCYDGVGKQSVNLNQGAESTISYLLARLAFEGNRVTV